MLLQKRQPLAGRRAAAWAALHAPPSSAPTAAPAGSSGCSAAGETWTRCCPRAPPAGRAASHGCWRLQPMQRRLAARERQRRPKRRAAATGATRRGVPPQARWRPPSPGCGRQQGQWPLALPPSQVTAPAHRTTGPAPTGLLPAWKPTARGAPGAAGLRLARWRPALGGGAHAAGATSQGRRCRWHRGCGQDWNGPSIVSIVAQRCPANRAVNDYT